jgi:rhomboid protease GluP
MGDEIDNQGAFAPHDGTLEYCGYSDAQLRDLLLHMDKTRFPRNFANLEAEIARRGEAGTDRRIPVRFTAVDGIAGWLQALAAWQPLYGSGGITCRDDQVVIEGWKRTWLGAAEQSEVVIAARRLRNVYGDIEWLSFDVQRRFWFPRHYVVRCADAQAAAILAASLPHTRSKWFEKQATNVRDFYRLQRTPDRRALVTTLLVVTSIVIYLAQAATSGYWLNLPTGTLFDWGANIGSFTVHGGWWRLLAALFLHIDPLHLIVNMWVLWSTGRLVERLFGGISFAAIYFTAGIVGGLLSVAWNPAGMTVGASGAIFGILGALLAYLLHGRTRIPQPVMRAHLIPTTLFTIFSILNGLAHVGIDNAAHVGGLVSGLLLGWALASPPGQKLGKVQLAQSAVAILAVALTAAGLLLQVTGPVSNSSSQEQFLVDHGWYRQGEAANLLRWQEIANQVAAGTIPNADLKQHFEAEIIPFWRDTAPKLRKELATAPTASRAILQAVAEFADLRLRWARAIVDSTKSNNSQAAIDLMQKTDFAQARLDWFNLRIQYDHRAASLAESPLVASIANIAWLNYRSCTLYPYPEVNSVAASDLVGDSPARMLALSCQAQHLFMTRDFRELEEMLQQARRHPRDLLDGSSSYDAITGGLSNLVTYGGLSLDDVMERVADWRRVVPSSVEADLAEVTALISWAYSARGNGFADSVSAQGQWIFLHRIAMADAALKALEPRAKNYVAWYSSAIDVNLLGNGKEEERRIIFDRAHARFPQDIGLDSAMLHSLMPRWGGSFEKVARFIVEQSRQESADTAQFEKYARLYWIYARLEDKQADIFKDAFARPDDISLGMASAVKRHPNSDYLVNVAGRLACQSNQRLEYLTFHSLLAKRYSASAWSPDFTVERCNRKFGLKS